jgi:hypothetical protein
VERVERREPVEGECPSCGVRLSEVEAAREVALCGSCDERLDREVAAYLAFVKVCRSP